MYLVTIAMPDHVVLRKPVQPVLFSLMNADCCYDSIAAVLKVIKAEKTSLLHCDSE